MDQFNAKSALLNCLKPIDRRDARLIRCVKLQHLFKAYM